MAAAASFRSTNLYLSMQSEEGQYYPAAAAGAHVKRAVCKFFNSAKGCSHGERCHFAHAPSKTKAFHAKKQLVQENDDLIQENERLKQQIAALKEQRQNDQLQTQTNFAQLMARQQALQTQNEQLSSQINNLKMQNDQLAQTIELMKAKQQKKVNDAIVVKRLLNELQEVTAMRDQLRMELNHLKAYYLFLHSTPVSNT